MNVFGLEEAKALDGGGWGGRMEPHHGTLRRVTGLPKRGDVRGSCRDLRGIPERVGFTDCYSPGTGLWKTQR